MYIYIHIIILYIHILYYTIMICIYIYNNIIYSHIFPIQHNAMQPPSHPNPHPQRDWRSIPWPWLGGLFGQVTIARWSRLRTPQCESDPRWARKSPGQSIPCRCAPWSSALRSALSNVCTMHDTSGVGTSSNIPSTGFLVATLICLKFQVANLPFFLGFWTKFGQLLGMGKVRLEICRIT